MTTADLPTAWDDLFASAAARYQSRFKGAARPTGTRADHRKLQEWAAQAAEHLASIAHVGPSAAGTPAPIAEIALELGRKVTYRNQTFDGHLSPDNGGEIRIRVGTPITRARFTIAHELGHLWLTDHAPRSHPATGLSRVATERLCDAIAANLLVPQTHLSTLPRFPDLHALRQLAESIKVSAQVVANQATRRGHWRCLLLDWNLSASGWEVHSFAGGPWDARRWTMRSDAIPTPIVAQRCQLEVETQFGARRMTAQIGSWSRTRLTTLLTPAPSTRSAAAKR